MCKASLGGAAMEIEKLCLFTSFYSMKKTTTEFGLKYSLHGLNETFVQNSTQQKSEF